MKLEYILSKKNHRPIIFALVDVPLTFYIIYFNFRTFSCMPTKPFAFANGLFADNITV